MFSLIFPESSSRRCTTNNSGSDQLLCTQQKADILTTGAGHPVGDKLNLQTAGPRGPLLVQDVVFTDEMAHFDRERIPERVVHAKGAGENCYHL